MVQINLMGTYRNGTGYYNFKKKSMIIKINVQRTNLYCCDFSNQLSLSLDYRFHVYSMHDPNQCYPLVLNNSQFSCFNYRQDITYMRLALPKNGSSMFGLGLPLQPRPGPLTWLFPQGEPIYSASASSAEGTVIPLPANPPLPLWVP